MDEGSEIARLKARVLELEMPFQALAASAGVPPQVVADAAAHTFDMLDVDDQVSVIEDAMARYKAHRKMATCDGVILSEESGLMKADLIYRLQHEHFDAVYAIAMRLGDAPGGIESAQWVMTPPRPGETETPTVRSIAMMETVCKAMRYAKQKFETIVTKQRARLLAVSKTG